MHDTDHTRKSRIPTLVMSISDLRSNMQFVDAKILHGIHGHDHFVSVVAQEFDLSETFIYNVCADVVCPQKGKDKTDHQWERSVFKNNPALKCRVCDFIWQPHMRRPKVTCEQILNNRNPRKK